MWLKAEHTLSRIAELGQREGVIFCLENLNTAVDHLCTPFARAGDTLGLVTADQCLCAIHWRSPGCRCSRPLRAWDGGDQLSPHRSGVARDRLPGHRWTRGLGICGQRTRARTLPGRILGGTLAAPRWRTSVTGGQECLASHLEMTDESRRQALQGDRVYRTGSYSADAVVARGTTATGSRARRISGDETPPSRTRRTGP
jgi:hypothetical protein